MLLGHVDDYTAAVKMQETIAFNNFREGLVQCMPGYPKRSEFTFSIWVSWINNQSNIIVQKFIWKKKIKALMLKHRY